MDPLTQLKVLKITGGEGWREQEEMQEVSGQRGDVNRELRNRASEGISSLEG